MKEDFIKPIVVLTLICLIVSGALAFTNSVTEPVIADAAAVRTEAAMFEIMPDAKEFELITFDEQPETVKEIYRATGSDGTYTGFIIVLSTDGFGGDIRIMFGISVGMKIIQVKTLEHNETKGMGSKITEQEFESQFTNVTRDLEGVDIITGATVSSSAYIKAVKDALALFVDVPALD